MSFRAASDVTYSNDPYLASESHLFQAVELKPEAALRNVTTCHHHRWPESARRAEKAELKQNNQ